MDTFFTVRDYNDKFLLTMYAGKVGESPVKMTASIVDLNGLSFFIKHLKLI